MRFFMTFSYDGTNFNGYQKQPRKRTIQKEIESKVKVDWHNNKDIHNELAQYIEDTIKNDKNMYLPEYTIRFVDDDIRLESNIDLVIIKPNNHIEIWDWKTNSNLEKAKNYNTSMQTQVYLYSIKKIVKDILGIDVEYENISMTYFNPENKLELAKVVYSKELDELYYQNISDLIEKIYNYNYQNFDRSKYLKNCKFCEFNLFCSNIKEKDVEFSQEIDFDTIDEFM